MRNKYIIILAGILLLSGCGKKEAVESKSLEQLHKENGVPVKVRVLSEESFSKKLDYNGKLTGVNQATEQSLVGGTVEKINFEEGDLVKEGDVIVTFPQDLSGMNYQAVRANYDVMSASYERLKNLYQDGGISQQKVDNVKAGYLAAESQLNTVEKMLEVRAPIDGYLVEIYVDETDHVESGDLLFTVAELDRLKSKVTVTEKEIGMIQKGSAAIAKWEGNEYQGTITAVGYAMNERSGAFEVDLEFDNPDKIMKFNINAMIELEVYHNPAAIVVEKKNLLRDSSGDFVYIIKGDRAEKRYVITGQFSGLDFEIISGLAAGEKLVVESRNLLEDGSLVQISR
ncbi:MAG: efflux RND transporter periplasmic adaptor subunit [Candidatus Stygibacter australis]|nr:efflux RND transporter periplasmic adaptor subunit [Candidatus Stygibacter australis]MDP8321734.1 efflux RND transporter periplasmic adaptor subunit [Candidatus Stygibacter australis]